MKRILLVLTLVIVMCTGCGDATPKGVVKIQKGKFLIQGNSVVENALKQKYNNRGFEIQSIRDENDNLYGTAKQIGYDDEFTVNVIDGVVYDDYHKTVNKDITMNLVNEVLKANETLDITYDYEFILKSNNIVDGNLESYLRGNPGHIIMKCKSYSTDIVALASELYKLIYVADTYGLYYIIDCEWNGQNVRLDNTIENNYTADDKVKDEQSLAEVLTSGSLFITLDTEVAK